jgi:hypothetical protein
MATGIITDADGSAHPVTFTTEHHDEQSVAVVAPGPINLSLDPASVEAEPGKPVIITIQLNRDKGASGDVRCELACPRHIIGVTAATLVIPAGQNTGTLQLDFTDRAVGPFNMPLTIRATTTDSHGYPVVAEAPLSVAAPRSR